MAWQNVRLAELLTLRRERIGIERGKTYRQITVRLWGKGLALRGVADGSEIKAETQVAVKAGDFLISKIDARHGAFGLVPDELHDAVVSNDFPCFAVNEAVVLPQFLGWYSRTDGFVAMCRRASAGSTNRVRLKEKQFLELEIPLPSLDEQRAIVQRLDAVQAKVKAALSLENAIQVDLQRLLVSMAHRPDLTEPDKIKLGWKEDEFGGFLTEAAEPYQVHPEKQYPNLGIYSYARGVFKKSAIEGAQTSARTLFKIRKNQFIYSRLFAF